jgi:hypothetical protein
MIDSHLAREDLHLAAQTTKGAAVKNSISIASKRAAISMRRFGIDTTARVRTVHRIRCQQQMLAICVSPQIDHRLGLCPFQASPPLLDTSSNASLAKLHELVELVRLDSPSLANTLP